jgi:hypothetical protein
MAVSGHVTLSEAQKYVTDGEQKNGRSGDGKARCRIKTWTGGD